MSTRADPFDVFPVAAPHHYSDDFGAPRPGGRTHQGNDIFCSSGAPCVAPFAGVLIPFVSPLCGVGAQVQNAVGHVTYCHLLRLAHAPGPIKAGTVVGYADNSGDALHTATHLHFEWHPGPPGAPAIDPFPFLQASEGKMAKSKGCPPYHFRILGKCVPIPGNILAPGATSPANIAKAASPLDAFFGSIGAYLTIAAGGVLIIVAVWIALRELGAPVPSVPEVAKPPAVRYAGAVRKRKAAASKYEPQRVRRPVDTARPKIGRATPVGDEERPFNKATYRRQVGSRQRARATAARGHP